MDAEDWGGCVLFVALCLAIFAGGFSCARSEWKTEAVQHGAAYWQVADDGTVEFKWKEPPYAPR